MHCILECQTDDQEDLVGEISILRTLYLKFDEQLFKGNAKLTRFYTGMPTYDSFLALAEYLEPKVKEMRV